ncbi:hypothetical protein [Haloferula rosea]|uniref:Uncharacterized protein n=1 Tax=Haloferula rosea TaxID=490093 RepID=A0A934VHH0_9BACT|nr:hypothetical protein [Haloferula rosea]MBK1829051.1 hypothetical protein [Haloferula rosea]
MKHYLFQLIFGIVVLSPLKGAEGLTATELTESDVLTLLNARGWSFSFSPAKPVRRLDVLVYEVRTDGAGNTKTSIHRACTLGMLPKERTYPIKMLLVGRELHTSIDAAKGSIELSDDFIMGTFEYRKSGSSDKDKDERRFLIEVGNKKEFKGKAPFKTELRFRIFENLDQATLIQLLGGD